MIGYRAVDIIVNVIFLSVIIWIDVNILSAFVVDVKLLYQTEVCNYWCQTAVNNDVYLLSVIVNNYCQ